MNSKFDTSLIILGVNLTDETMCQQYEELCLKFPEGQFVNLDFNSELLDRQLKQIETAISLYNSVSDPFISEIIDFN
jgi:hypothetical protein